MPLSLGMYLISPPPIPTWPAVCGIFPNIFIWQSHCCDYWRVWTLHRRWLIMSTFYIEQCFEVSNIWTNLCFFFFKNTLLFLHVNYFELMKNVK
jgi:hypothetical protein